MRTKLAAMRALEAVGRTGTRAIGWFAGLSLVLAVTGLDPTWLWLSRGIARSPLHYPLLAMLAVAALAPLHRLDGRWRRRAELAARGVLLGVAALALVAAVLCWVAWGNGLRAMFPVPFSAMIAAVLAVHGLSPWTPPGAPSWRRRLFGAGATAAGLVGIAAAQIAAVAYTDHRRPADAIVVLGARVYESGRPSEALAQRVATACELYAEGYAGKILMSGARDPGARVSEPEAMRDLALQCGVPREAILLDEQGVDTHSTAVNTARILGEGTRVLAVSHGYHLARVQIALDGQGVVAFTVPARERILLPRKPWYVAREIVAWVVYLARG